MNGVANKPQGNLTINLGKKTRKQYILWYRWDFNVSCIIFLAVT